MSTETTQRAAELSVILARHYPDASAAMIARVVVSMQRAARAAKAWGERCCNEPMDDATAKRGNGRVSRKEHETNDILAHPRLMPPRFRDAGEALRTDAATVELGGDPRGACGTLRVPGLTGDGFGGGFAIY